MERPKKLRGRPALTTGLRNKKIDTRFTEEEFEQILNLETELGIKRTDLVRMRMLQGSKQIVVNAKSFIDQLDAIGMHMGRTADNITQLACYVESLDRKNASSTDLINRYNLLLEKYNRSQQSLEITLRKIIRQLARQ